MKIKTLSLMVILFTLACTNNSKKQNEHITFSHFPKEVNVEFEEIAVADELYFVGDILVLKDALVTLDMKASPFFQVFEYPNLSHLEGFVKRGEGPGEEIMIVPKLTRLDQNTFYYRTFNAIKIVQYKTINKTLEIVETIPLNDVATELTHSILLGDNIYGYGMNIKTKKEFVGISLVNGNQTDFGPDFPDVGMDIKETNKGVFFSKILGVKISGGTRFAALYDKFPMLRIYNRSGELLKDIRYENGQSLPYVYTEGKMNIDDLNQAMLNYLKIDVTDDYIYGLYAGKTQGELRTQELQVDDFGCEIHIWDWDGNPKARLLLPQNMFTFSVSIDNECILLSSVRVEDKIFKLKLPSL